MTNKHDFAIARDRHWYRIPLDRAESWYAKCWPPRWLAFYQTEVFGREEYSVSYYAPVRDLCQVPRRELFPDQPRDERSEKLYHKLLIGPLQTLPKPIYSHRRRRIAFIATTYDKLVSAQEINDLFDESPLEDRLWNEFKRRQIPAERQEYVELDSGPSFLDFSIYCARGKLDVETDGDTSHGNPEQITADYRRDTALQRKGWTVLRFTRAQIDDRLMEYCIPKIVSKINELGDIKESGLPPRRIEISFKGTVRQRRLFPD